MTNTQFSLLQMKNLESNFTELTAHLETNGKNLAEINNTMLRKVKG